MKKFQTLVPVVKPVLPSAPGGKFGFSSAIVKGDRSGRIFRMKKFQP